VSRVAIRFLRCVRRLTRVRIVRPGYPAVRHDCSLLLLAALFVFNAFDLAFTQSQIPRGNFNELNQLAAGVIDCPIQIAAYKTLLFGAGAIILARLRKHRLSQAGLYVLCTCYGGLMVWWHQYIRCVEVCLSDPTSLAMSVPL
jgi:hypothetical protein